jgi:hypothetical protein
VSFGWIGRPRRIVVTAFTRDRRILRQWDLDLRVGQRVSIPEGTRTVQIDDATTITRTRVRLGQARGRRPRR